MRSSSRNGTNLDEFYSGSISASSGTLWQENSQKSDGSCHRVRIQTMEGRNLKKYIKLLLIIQFYMIMLFPAGFLRIPPAHAFFEEQVKYGFESPLVTDVG